MTKSKSTNKQSTANEKGSIALRPGSGTQKRGRLPHTNRRVEMVPVGQLTVYKGNARTHSCQQVRQIADSIKRFGFNNPVLIDADNEIIAGHGRVEAAKRLGLTKVPTLRLSHLSPAEKRAFVIADNRLAELAGWDRDILAIELQALIDLNFEVELTGFDVGDLDIILNAEEGGGESADPGDEVPDRVSRAPVSQAGDVWLLGQHELRCGHDQDQRADAAADAVIRRWQRFTGKSAVLAGVGKIFAEVEKERARTTSPAAARQPAAAAKREAA